MLIKPSPWDYETFYRSKHPEYVAIRNIVLNNPQHEFILIGQGLHYEHFRLGTTLFYNLGTGSKFKFLFSFYLNFWLPLMFRPSVIVGVSGVNLVPLKLASILIRAKFITVLIGDIWFTVSEIPKFARSITKVFLRATFQSSYIILSISKSIKKELTQHYKTPAQKVFVYRYRISDIFHPNVNKNLKNELNPSGPILLTVCRISKQKGLQYLVEAASAVIDKFPNVKFVIRAYANEPDSRKNLLNLISTRNLKNYFKIIEEFSPYEEIPKYMAAADVFVLPSISEGLAVVVLEAMACGLPVIATRVGGIPDVIIDNYNGLLIQPTDVKGLEDAIIRLLKEKDTRQELSQGALLTAQSAKKIEFQDILTKFIFS